MLLTHGETLIASNIDPMSKHDNMNKSVKWTIKMNEKFETVIRV